MSGRYFLRRARVCAFAQVGLAQARQNWLFSAASASTHLHQSFSCAPTAGTSIKASPWDLHSSFCYVPTSGTSIKASPWDLHQSFCYATRSAAADGYLVDVLKSEIEHELREEVAKKGSLKDSAGAFDISDKAGTEEVILRRNFGKEQIAITCLVESQYPAEDEEAEQEATEHKHEESEENVDISGDNKPVEVLHLSVTITKEAPMPALEFECSYVRGAEEVDIKSVNFLTEDPAENEPQPYTGPDVDDLDERLQQAFHQLLKARGLTPKVATYVLDYLTVKEHREYMRWLHNVETFFSS